MTWSEAVLTLILAALALGLDWAVNLRQGRQK